MSHLLGRFLLELGRAAAQNWKAKNDEWIKRTEWLKFDENGIHVAKTFGGFKYILWSELEGVWIEVTRVLSHISKTYVLVSRGKRHAFPVWYDQKRELEARILAKCQGSRIESFTDAILCNKNSLIFVWSGQVQAKQR